MSFSYTIAPHLEYFNIPIADFRSSRPEFESLAVGAFIFCQHADPASPRLLLLQRALTDSMPGCWEGPGGASEPDEDKTLLDGVVREVLEETGLHVSRIVDLVGVDSWTHTNRQTGRKFQVAKYSFIVDVCESVRAMPDGSQQCFAPEQIPVRLEASEHKAFEWAKEKDVHYSIQTGEGRYKFPPAWMNQRLPGVIWCFELYRKHQSKTT